MERRVMTKEGLQKIASTRAKLAFMIQDLSKEMVPNSKELDHFLLKAEELNYFATRGITLNPKNYTTSEIKTEQEKK